MQGLESLYLLLTIRKRIAPHSPDIINFSILAIRLENSGYWKVCIVWTRCSSCSKNRLSVLTLYNVLLFGKNETADAHVEDAGGETIESNSAESQMSAVSTTNDSAAADVILTERHKELCKRLYQLFQNNLTKVAQCMAIPEATLRRQVELERFEFKLTDPPLPSNRTKQHKTNNYNQEWVKRIVQATSHPLFSPCVHTGQCSEENCSCVQNRFFCTKACIWGAYSRNFFRGCNCSSRCQQKSVSSMGSCLRQQLHTLVFRSCIVRKFLSATLSSVSLFCR